MLKYLTLGAALCISLSALADHFKVIAPTAPDSEGETAQLVNYDNGAVIATAVAGPESVVFEGEIDEPVIARITIDGNRMPAFILEGGTISFSHNNNAPFGSMLNDQLRDFSAHIGQLASQYSTSSSASEAAAIERRYAAMMDSAINANSDNALGYFIFLQDDFSDYSLAQIDSVLAKYPGFATGERINRYRTMALTRENTQPGKKYTDFEITYNGKTEKLSDYVQPGKYTLVDFWASWCGPCIRQIQVLKDLYNEYSRDKLDIVGVAVWDEPDNTLEAIARHNIPWPSIIDAQTIPTDLYGIVGIPCIILIGPDGTILSRGLHGDELKADVRRFLSE